MSRASARCGTARPELADVAGVALGELLPQLFDRRLELCDLCTRVVEVVLRLGEPLLVAERRDDLLHARAEQVRKVAVEALAVRDDGRDEALDELEVAHALLWLGWEEQEMLECRQEKVARAAVRVGEDGLEAATRVAEVHPHLLAHVLGELEGVELGVFIVLRDEALEVGVVEDEVLFEDALEPGELHGGAEVHADLEVSLAQELSDEEHVADLWAGRASQHCPREGKRTANAPRNLPGPGP